MNQKKYKIHKLLGVLLLSLLLILTFSCGKDDPAEQTKSEEPTKEETTKEEPEETESTNTENAYFFVPKFEEQVIYDEDGIKITVSFDDQSARAKYYNSHGLLNYTVENNTSKAIKLFFHDLLTADNLSLPLIAHPEVEPQDKTSARIGFMPSLSSAGFLGDYTLYQDYGLGKVLGDFRLRCTLRDKESDEELRKFITKEVKTEQTGLLPDYSLIHSKPVILDQDGVKFYHVDEFIVPKAPNEDWSSDNYVVILFYENDSDKSLSHSYHDVSINGVNASEYTISNIDKNDKGFLYFSMSKKDLDEKGISSVETLSFVMRLLENSEGGTKSDFISSEPIELNFSQPWKTLEIDYGN